MYRPATLSDCPDFPDLVIDSFRRNTERIIQITELTLLITPGLNTVFFGGACLAILTIKAVSLALPSSYVEKSLYWKEKKVESITQNLGGCFLVALPVLGNVLLIFLFMDLVPLN